MDRRHRSLVGLAAALAFLTAAGVATAALEVRLEVNPVRPRAGQVSSILLRPYFPYVREDGTCCRLEPTDVDYPFRVEAVSPAGRVFRVRVQRTSDPFLWSGRFVFRSKGRWQIRAANWGPRYQHAPGARPRVFVRIRA
jgi:hypothetical protein